MLNLHFSGANSAFKLQSLESSPTHKYWRLLHLNPRFFPSSQPIKADNKNYVYGVT